MEAILSELKAAVETAETTAVKCMDEGRQKNADYCAGFAAGLRTAIEKLQKK